MVKLIKSNLHKDRTIVIVFMLIITLAALLMHTSLLITQYDDTYDEKAKAQNIPDALTMVYTREDISGVLGSAKNLSEYSVSEIIATGETKFRINESSSEKTYSGILMFRKSDMSISGNYNFIERDESVPGKKIYMNLGLAKSNGICTGDVIHLTGKGFEELSYTVAGIYEDLLNGVSMSYNSVIFEDESYAELKPIAEKQFTTGAYDPILKLVYMRFNDGVESKDGLKEVRELLNANNIGSYGYTRELSRESYVGIISLLVPFLATFSLLMIIISVIMIIFAISNNINRDIKNIGALEAVGHTAGQIRRALVAEYLIVGGISSALGTGLSYILFPIIEKNLLRGLTGIVCEPGFIPSMSFGVFFGVIAVCIAAAFLTSAKIKKLHPSTALRFGLASNSFKRNHFPLADTKGSLNLLLAAKSAFQSMGQSISIFVVITMVSFLTFFSVMLFYNTKIETKSFAHLLQGDVADAYIEIDDPDEARRQEIMRQIKTIDGVKDVYSLNMETTTVGGDDVDTIYSAEPECIYCGVYEGVMCKEANEAVIGGVLAKKLGVGVGGEIRIRNGSNEASYIVTGLQQAVFSLGERVYITDAGMERIGAKHSHPSLRIRMNDPDGAKVDALLEKIRTMLGDECTYTENSYSYQRSSDNLPIFASGMIIAVFVMLNLIMIFLIIRLLLKTIFIKREKEFGIKKAVGFTSVQIRLQLSLSLLIPAVLASVLGSLMGYFLVNPLFNVVFESYGIKNSDLTVKPMMILFTIGSVLALVYALSFLMSHGIKKIAAYRLISE